MAENGSMRKRGNAWEFRAWVNGRRYHKTLPAEGGRAVGEKRAATALRRWVNELEGEVPKIPGKSVGAMLDRWWTQFSPAFAPGTRDAYETNIRLHIKPAWGDREASSISTDELEEWFFSLGKAPATVAKIRYILVSSFGSAKRWGWVTTNPVVDAESPKLGERTTTPPSKLELDQLMAAAGERKGYGPFLVFMHLSADTGGRRSMVTALKWSDVDLEGGTVTWRRKAVYDRVNHRVVVQPTTKTKKQWQVALHWTTADHLKAHKKLTTEQCELVGQRWSEDRFVFTAELNGSNPWFPTHPTQAFGRLRADLDLTHVRLHDLRHFMATQWLSLGVDQATVMGRGGWTSLSSLTRYSSWVPAVDAAAAARVGDAVFG